MLPSLFLPSSLYPVWGIVTVGNPQETLVVWLLRSPKPHRTLNHFQRHPQTHTDFCLSFYPRSYKPQTGMLGPRKLGIRSERSGALVAKASSS